MSKEMSEKQKSFHAALAHTTPFENAQEAWFWFIEAYQAKNEGARISAGMSLIPRPCEPLDILYTVDRLYRTRRLLWDHLLVLRHYGQRKMPPDPYRWKEAKAASLWQDALEKIESALIRKGIVRKPQKIMNEQKELCPL